MKIVLIGFMGTGKSSLGKLLARKLNFTFIDTDAVIEEHQGRSISAIFATDGEPFFRQLERELAGELALIQEAVISTGGGVSPESGEYSGVTARWVHSGPDGNAGSDLPAD